VLAGQAASVEQVTAILRHINDLYTVYHNIILFDAQRRIVAASNPDTASRAGAPIDEDWVARTLALRGSHDFAISDFKASTLYANQHTLIFGAAVRGGNGKTLGGIGIVFDAQPQFAAMLRDALPRSELGEISAGCIGLFVDQGMRVLAATSQYQSGDTIALPRELLKETSQTGARIVTLNGINYALGTRRTAGYREYRGLDAFALTLIPLGPAVAASAVVPRFSRTNAQRHGASHEAVVDIAAFRCVDQRLGVLRDQVVEAVDGVRLRSIPGSPPWHAGLLMYRDVPVPVIDVARLLETTTAPTVGDVVVARVPATGQFVGLLIHELGDIPEVSLSRMLPFTERTPRAGASIIDRAVRPESPDEAVLFIINLEQLILHTQSAAVGATAPSKSTTAAVPRQ
jgi:chemotaxis signal transduction protein